MDTNPTKPITIIKSKQDDREYRCVILENQLQVLLVSDPKADQAAAALDVNVGFFCDPPNTQGVAHFCEHMLFLGTEKYPDENEYTNYLTTHGGNSNAFTSSENTNYYFDVSHPNLEGALDRFAQFFIGPLFTQSATEREMCAIDSEHSKNLQNDGWRTNQFARFVSNPGHPFSKFGTGSMETLKKHEDIRQQLLDYHSKYYSANLMKLTIYGVESVDILEGWARKYFSDIQNKNVPVPTFGNEAPFPPAFTQTLHHVVPIKNLRVVNFQWMIPADQGLYKMKPAGIVSHLIGHEGKGSILSFLKKKGWANELTAGVSEEGSDYSIFTVFISLAPDGLEKVNEIASSVFEYIKRIRLNGGVEKWVFEELQMLQSMAFQFQDKVPPFRYVSSLAGNMQIYDPEHVLSGPYLLHEFRADLVNAVLDALTPSNVSITVQSKTFEGQTDKVETWYGIQYKEQKIDPELIKLWTDSEPDAELQLPHPNQFLPSDFDRHIPGKEHIADVPKAVCGEGYTLWYKYDTEFETPKAYMIFNLTMPCAYESPTTTVMTSLYCRLVTDALNEYSYDAQVANLSYSLSNTQEGVKLVVKGYNCKQKILLEKILHMMTTIQIDPERFAVVKEALTRGYANFNKEQPYQRVMYESMVTLEPGRWINAQYLDAIHDITLPQTQQFVSRLLSSLYIELFAIGNIRIDEAKEAVNLVWKLTGAKVLDLQTLPSKNHMNIPEGTEFIRRMNGFNPEEKNSAIEFLLQIGQPDMKGIAELELFSQLTSAASSNQLRTVEQLGYIVWSGPKSDFGIRYFRVLIQSDVKGPDYLDQRIEAWLQSYEETLLQMSDKEFEETKKGLIAQKLEKDKSLKDATAKWSLEIAFPRTQLFKRGAIEAEAIDKLTKDDVLAFYRKYIAKGSLHRAKVNTEIYATDHAIPDPQSVSNGVQLISELKGWQAATPQFPSELRHIPTSEHHF